MQKIREKLPYMLAVVILLVCIFTLRFWQILVATVLLCAGLMVYTTMRRGPRQ